MPSGAKSYMIDSGLRFMAIGNLAAIRCITRLHTKDSRSCGFTNLRAALVFILFKIIFMATLTKSLDYSGICCEGICAVKRKFLTK